jgi:hypothetical protein
MASFMPGCAPGGIASVSDASSNARAMNGSSVMAVVASLPHGLHFDPIPLPADEATLRSKELPWMLPRPA